MWRLGHQPYIILPHVLKKSPEEGQMSNAAMQTIRGWREWHKLKKPGTVPSAELSQSLSHALCFYWIAIISGNVSWSQRSSPRLATARHRCITRLFILDLPCTPSSRSSPARFTYPRFKSTALIFRFGDYSCIKKQKEDTLHASVRFLTLTIRYS